MVPSGDVTDMRILDHMSADKSYGLVPVGVDIGFPDDIDSNAVGWVSFEQAF